VIDTFLGPVEKKALLWLAARMPPWVMPDTLTLIGLIASIIIFLGYALTIYDKAFLWLASLGFVLNWFGDSLDGNLARYRKIERPRYGFFVDHIIDTVSEGLIFLGLGISPYLRFDLALLAMASYLWLSVYVYLATYVNGVFRISYARMGPTEVRVLGILANTVIFFSGNPRINLALGTRLFSLTIYDVVGIVFVVLATGLFIYNSIVTAMLLSREDRIAAQMRRRAERAARRQARLEQRAMNSTRVAEVNIATSRLVGVPSTGSPEKGGDKTPRKPRLAQPNAPKDEK
jgi:phosphatidylglycerophosphate synthase